MRKIVYLVAFFALFVLFFYVTFDEKRGVDSDKTKDNGISVILTGFGSKNLLGAWSGEIAPFINKLENPKEVSDKIGMCDYGFEGELYGQKVLVATTGMAKVKTAACLTNILHNYEGGVKEVIFVGIAGITPSKRDYGSEQDGIGISQPAMLGDVCINSLAFDFDLQHYSSDEENSNIPNPLFWSQESSFSSQFVKSGSALAEELYSASLKVVWPTTPQDIKDINVAYHKTSREPKTWGLSECLEATSDLYWHDTKADARAREIAAGYLSQAYNVSVNPSSVLIVTSMEALPVGAVVNWWNESEDTTISYAYARGASNFDQTFTNAEGNPAKSPQASIEMFRKSGSSQYAIETAALPVLKMFEVRNEAK